MEMDTGATLTIMNVATGAGMENNPPLQKSNTRLHTYTGDKLNVWGTMEVSIDYQGQHYKSPVIVVMEKGPNLLGRNWLNVIKPRCST